MEELPEPALEKLLICEQEESKLRLMPHAPVDKYYEALVTGDLKKLKALTDQYYEAVNMVFEISKNELEWQVKSQAAFGLSGLWSLEYKRDLTNPLCISASHGYIACLRHLLFWRADPNAAPGGRAALHEACERGHTDCAELLLEHKANPNLLSNDGQTPLHLCTSQNTFGYFLQGLDGCKWFVAKITVSSPRKSNQLIAKSVPSASGTQIRLFTKTVLKSCASVPEIIEILCNSYPHLPVSEKWMEAVPKEDFERHLPFYKSFFSQMYTVRCLQHLCRCAIRKRFNNRCHDLIPTLPVPKPLQSYLMLEPEGIVL